MFVRSITLLVFTLLCSSPVAAQTSWQFSPYRMLVWLTFDDSPELTPAMRQRVSQELVDRAYVVARSTWDVTVSAPPPQLRSRILNDVAGVAVDHLKETDLTVVFTKGDKEEGIEPPDIKKLTDLAEGVTVGVGDPETTIAGRLTRQLFEEQGLQIAPDVTAGSSRDLVRFVMEGQIQAAVVLRDDAAGLFKDLNELRIKEFPGNSSAVLNHDKLIILAVTGVPDGFQIQARELDCNSRMWGQTDVRLVRQPPCLPAEAFACVTDVFRPVAKVEDPDGRDVFVRMRAGGLIVHNDSLASVHEESLMLPVTRRNDKFGEPREFNGVTKVDWTWLRVTGKYRSRFTCKIHSGMANPFGGRVNSRTKRYALGVRIRHPSTELHLLSLEKEPKPLADYEIYGKDPITDEINLIGLTDWRGYLAIGEQPNPITMAYVKNGGRLLARLPLVPGFESTVDAYVADDTIRLRAEGYVKGLQSSAMDLVAQRQVLSMRIKKRIEERKFDDADDLIEQFRALPSLVTMIKRLDRGRILNQTADKAAQKKIHRLFEDTRELLTKYIDPTTADKLTRELKAAQRGA